MMNLPLSNRLLCCASMVPKGARVADIGTDHGYLPIYLLQQGIACSVAACDLREGPLSSARTHAQRFGVTKGLSFYLSDGLERVEPGSVDTVVCAGMGGELIWRILEAAPWACAPGMTLILQPQNAAQELRVWLAAHGMRAEREDLAKDGGFVYNVMLVRNGAPPALTAGQRYIPPLLLAGGSSLLPEYMARIRVSLYKTVEGMKRAASPDVQRLAEYEQALQEVQQMEEDYGNGSTTA